MKNILLLIGIALMIFSPLFLIKDAEFYGADTQAEEKILEVNPEYKPWFESIFEPASGEVESLLFALQAAIGAGVIGYAVGFYKGRGKVSKNSEI